MIVKKHINFISQSKDISIPFIQRFLPFYIIKGDNRKYVSLRMRNYGNHFKIYLFMSFRDIVGRFLPCQTQILVCVVKRVQIFYNGSEFCLAHAQREFVEVVLYQKIISSPNLISVESLMLVSGIAQSWRLAA